MELLGIWGIEVGPDTGYGVAREMLLEDLMEANRQLAMMGPTVIIRDFNAAPTMDDRGRQHTPEDTVVKVAMQHTGLQDLTASLRGPS